MAKEENVTQLVDLLNLGDIQNINQNVNSFQGEKINHFLPNHQTPSTDNASQIPQSILKTQSNQNYSYNYAGLFPYKCPDGKIMFLPFPPPLSKTASEISTNSKVSWV